MNASQFDQLPPLIDRAEFLDATGLTVDTLAKLVEAGQIQRCRLIPGSRKTKYWWDQAAAIRRGTKIPVKPTKLT